MYMQCTYNGVMADLRIEWDRRKAATNKQKHGVAPEEAATTEGERDQYRAG